MKEDTLAEIVLETKMALTRRREIILALDTVMKWKIHQMDAKTAFLNGAVQEKVYVEQPLGFETHDRETHEC